MQIFRTCAVGVMALATVSAASAGAQSAPVPQVYQGCAPVPTSFKRVLYVDPAGRSGTGGAADPFAQIAEALAVARPGDAIYLKTGDYGEVTVGGKNSEFVTIAAAPGERPVLTRLTIRQGARWRISGLTITGLELGALDGNGWQTHPGKIVIVGGDNIVLDGDIVSTTMGPYQWEAEVKGKAVPNALASGVSAVNMSCLSVVNSKIFNVFIGMDVGGDQSGDDGSKVLIKGNWIDNFAGDGIDHQVSHLLIQDNTITNGHDLCDNQCIHHDAIQGWNYHDWPNLLNTDIVIDKNFIVQKTQAVLPWAADDLHGITIFDGHWDGVEVENNVVVTPAWHGISLFGVRNAKIINNTVLSPDAEQRAWILVDSDKEETENSDLKISIRNNIAPTIVIGQHGRVLRGVREDHNLVGRDPGRLFVRFDIKTPFYDLHLKPASPAKGAGSADMAPSIDIEGKPRSGKIDVGAYGADARAGG